MPVPIRKESDTPVHRNIAKIAKLKVGSQDFGLDKDKGPGVGKPKHNTFVGEVCLSAGAYVSRRMINEIPPQSTGDWSDRGTTIPGWNVVVYPQPGDIIAYNGVPAVVTSHNTSVTVVDGVVQETNWGFRLGHENAVVRRFMPKNIHVNIVGPKRVRFSQRSGEAISCG